MLIILIEDKNASHGPGENTTANKHSTKGLESTICKAQDYIQGPAFFVYKIFFFQKRNNLNPPRTLVNN